MVVMSSFFRATALPVAAAFALSACGGSGLADDGPEQGEALTMTAAFYPLQFVGQAVGGDRVEVQNLTRPGQEPHDLELAPRDVARLSDSDLVVYLSGFQPAVDDAVGTEATDALDVAQAADLSLTYVPGEHSHGDDEHADDEHADDEHADDEHADEHAEGATDPHFWLDPTRLAAVGDVLADRLAEIDPDGAETYQDNAAALREQLTSLDDEMTAGLASCEVTDLVTSHNAFGYLADRYGFTQVGISGLSPEDEPDPRGLADVSRLVRDRGVTTVYTEVLVDPAVAETVAEEAGATTAVLDPLEGLTDASAGDDYVEVMRANLATLREGQSCA
jgi:zinc transport system substrate-binding protein